MDIYAAAQLIGGRTEQCDATAVHTAPDGTRAYVLLDGVGSTPKIRAWTRSAARRLARSAALRGDAEPALRAAYDKYAADLADVHPAVRTYYPKAAAVVAVTGSGNFLRVAWCGDARAYLLLNGSVRRLTNDHNLRRVYPPTDVYPMGGNRNVITSCLGSGSTEAAVMDYYGHPAIESMTVPALNSRLLLASDGAYEPIEDSCGGLAGHLNGDAAPTARRLVSSAVCLAGDKADNATALVADLRP